MRLSLDLSLGNVALLGGQVNPALELDFANDTYTLNGASVASTLAVSRASSAWRTATDGKTITAYGNNVARRDSRGLYLERARTRLSTYPTDHVNWAIVSSATRTALAVDGMFTPCLIGSAGSTAAMLSSNTSISLTAGDLVFYRALYKAGTSGKARLRIATAALTSTVEGAVGALLSTETGAGTWTVIRNIDYGSGSYGIEGIFTVGTTGTDYRLRFGPTSAVSGENVNDYGGFIALGADVGEWVFGTQNAAVTVADDLATVDITGLATTGFATKFTLGLNANTAVVHQVDIGASTDSIRAEMAPSGQLSVIAKISSSDVATVVLGTLNTRQEYTVAAQWRNNTLQAQVYGNAAVSSAFVGTMPAMTTARLFPSGGSFAVVSKAQFYDKAL